ncbi:MAG: hypothetical protein EU544_01965, partial [Promethearchaeota archaeon]
MAIQDKKLAINSIDDLIRCSTLASLLEVSGWPKPGNVHRTRNFDSTLYEHFLAGIAAIQPNIRKFCEKIYKRSLNVGEDYSYVKMGVFFKESIQQMIKWQKGGNVLLGHILLFAPLAAAATICLKSEQKSYATFRFNLEKVIKDSTVYDTLKLYEAIKLSNAGGLGQVEKYNLNDESSLIELQNNNVNLLKIFELSKDYDNISLEYSTCFNITLNEGLPYFLEQFKETQAINDSVVNTFLKILAEHPDTLIIRKAGREKAKNVQMKAQQILKVGGISSKKGL